MFELKHSHHWDQWQHCPCCPCRIHPKNVGNLMESIVGQVQRLWNLAAPASLLFLLFFILDPANVLSGAQGVRIKVLLQTGFHGLLFLWLGIKFGFVRVVQASFFIVIAFVLLAELIL